MKTIVFVLSTAMTLSQGPHRAASTAASGTFGNGDSRQVHCSADGRFVAFSSWADNLVSGDTNVATDVFVKDMTTGTIERVSVSSTGAQANGNCTEPRITPDGRYVVFVTTAGNLWAFDGNGTFDVYRHDRQTHTTVLASCSALGIVGNERSAAGSISDDGRFVAFASLAGNLAPNDQNGVVDVFVKDLDLSTIALVSATPGGAPGNQTSGGARIAGNGRYVAFDSFASDLIAGDGNGHQDAFVRDLVTAQTWCCSRGPGGVLGNGGSEALDISRDGQLVLWRSWATNLLATPTTGVAHQYVGSNVGGNTELVTVATGGAHADAASMFGDLSADGRFVVFQTLATNLVPGFGNPWSNRATVMLRDRVAGTTVAAGRDLGGSAPRADCEQPCMTDEARLVLFATTSIDVLHGHDGLAAQVVVADQRPDVPATFALRGAGCAGSAGVPMLDRDPETLAWGGTSLRLQGDGAVLGFGILALGFSATSWNGMALPLPLDGFGLAGCRLFTSVDLSIAITTGAYSPWQVALAIPNDPTWRGVTMHTQAWLLDPWANALGATVSNAASFTIGQ
ncbi:MAG: PD40 domain-containing protein [Planctomycetes bacterium]|nr:PD40 domain-containing protein [Planctomycetota bacterium]